MFVLNCAIGHAKRQFHGSNFFSDETATFLYRNGPPERTVRPPGLPRLVPPWPDLRNIGQTLLDCMRLEPKLN
jgi:hypothetical protein